MLNIHKLNIPHILSQRFTPHLLFYKTLYKHLSVISFMLRVNFKIKFKDKQFNGKTYKINLLHIDLNNIIVPEMVGTEYQDSKLYTDFPLVLQYLTISTIMMMI